MKDLSMHILDILQNSVKAGATCISTEITENLSENLLSIKISDNGCGIPADMLEKIRDPFTTTRTTRKVGLGIPMLEQTCVQCGGRLEIESAEGQGCTVEAVMRHENIDRPPLGDVASTMHMLVVTNEDIDFIYKHIKNGAEFILDTVQIKEVLGGVPLSEPAVSEWLDGFIREGLDGLH